jgi:RNA polymerase sigma-70 factor (ECF subfamily)
MVRSRSPESVDDTGLPERADATLLAGLRAGDERAFVSLIALHQRAMLRIAKVYVSSNATAEDVVQETLLAVLQGVDRFEGRSSLKTWIFRILTNRAKTAARMERRCRPDTAQTIRQLDGPSVPAERFLTGRDDPEWAGHWKDEVRSWGPAADHGIVSAEAAGVVQCAIRNLPTLQRMVVTLRDAECWSAEEVCRLLEVSESNQRVLLHRGRSTVRQHLENFYARQPEDTGGHNA